jgi:hypothetical protein
MRYEYIMLVPHVIFALKKTFFYYRNIILCYLGGPHVNSAWDEIFLDETQNSDTLASGWPTCHLSLG